jgi:hypothetical protein
MTSSGKTRSLLSGVASAINNSGFTILREAWLGIEPYLSLSRYFYSDMWHKDNMFVGSVGFTLNTKKNYIDFPIKSS